MNELAMNSDQFVPLKIANLFLIGKKEQEIADELGMDVMQVQYILSEDKIQKYIQTTSGNEELQVNMKRIRKANELQDVILKKLEDFLHSDIGVASWKDSHVNLIKDVLLKSLPNTISKTIGLAIQMNFGKGSTPIDHVDETIAGVLKKLTPGQVILFREIIDKVSNLFLQGRTEIIIQLQKMLEEF